MLSIYLASSQLLFLKHKSVHILQYLSKRFGDKGQSDLPSLFQTLQKEDGRNEPFGS